VPVVLRIIAISRSKTVTAEQPEPWPAAPEGRRREQAMARTCLSVPSTDSGMSARFGGGVPVLGRRAMALGDVRPIPGHALPSDDERRSPFATCSSG
jgi:hypothetical protein